MRKFRMRRGEILEGNMTKEEMIQYYMKEYGVLKIIAERMFYLLYEKERN